MKKIDLDALRILLREGEVNFSFTKKDGSIRNARGTLNFDFIPETQHPSGNNDKPVNNLRFFDLENEGWRSLAADLQEVELLESKE